MQPHPRYSSLSSKFQFDNPPAPGEKKNEKETTTRCDLLQAKHSQEFINKNLFMEYNKATRNKTTNIIKPKERDESPDTSYTNDTLTYQRTLLNQTLNNDESIFSCKFQSQPQENTYLI